LTWDERPLVIGVALLLAATSGTAAAQEMGASAIDVRVTDGSLMVDVRDAPLADVLRAIGDRAHIAVTVSGRLDTRVTRSFVSSSVEDAIRQLARGHSTVWTYAPSRTAPGAQELTRLVVIASTAPPPAAPIGAQERATRLMRIRQLARRPGRAAMLELVRFSRDADALVRMEALRALRRAQGEAATSSLANALRGDPDWRVRSTAAHLLAGSSSDEARRALEAAATDADASVRRAAAIALAGRRGQAR
jgi:hypothetical protein